MSESTNTSIERGEGQGTCATEMSHNVPECPTRADFLNERQLAALKLMIAGKPDAQIARTIKVDRRTLHRWRRQDENFRAELKRRRQILCAESPDRLRSLLAPALDVMERDLSDRCNRNRLRAAYALLQLSNVREAVQMNDKDRVP